MLDEVELKIVHKDEKVIGRGKRSKTLSEVKAVENISKNSQSFLEIGPVQKEVPLFEPCPLPPFIKGQGSTFQKLMKMGGSENVC